MVPAVPAEIRRWNQRYLRSRRTGTKVARKGEGRASRVRTRYQEREPIVVPDVVRSVSRACDREVPSVPDINRAVPGG